MRPAPVQRRRQWKLQHVDNVYHGYMTVDRDIQLSSDGMQATGPAWVVRFDVNDNPIVQLCGEGLSTRL